MSAIVLKSFTVTLPNLPAPFAGYRFLHLSDLHLGRGLDRSSEILDLVAAHPVDAIVLTGDLLHDEKHLEYGPQFLSDLRRASQVRDGLFGVFGNHDLFLKKEEYRDELFHWLDNTSVRIRRDGASLSLIGLNQKDWVRTAYLKALREVDPQEVKIVLAHYPSTVYLLNGIIDLVISGHTHAGQIRLPGLPYKTNDDIPWRKGAGVVRIGQTTLIVSAGIGYSGPLNVRLFASSEIGLITLR